MLQALSHGMTCDNSDITATTNADAAPSRTSMADGGIFGTAMSTNSMPRGGSSTGGTFSSTGGTFSSVGGTACRLSKDDNLVHDGRGSLLPPPAYLRARSDANHACGDVAGTLMSQRTATLSFPCGGYNSVPSTEAYRRLGGWQEEQHMLLSEASALTCPWTSKRHCRRVSHHGDLSNPLVPPTHPVVPAAPSSAVPSHTTEACEALVVPAGQPGGKPPTNGQPQQLLAMLPPKGLPQSFKRGGSGEAAVPAPLIAAAHEDGTASCYVTTV